MGEEKNIDELFRSALEHMSVNPPESSRFAIEAALEKKRAVLYQKRINNYRMLAAVLAFLLISFAGYYLLQPFNTLEVVNNPAEINPGAGDKNLELQNNSSIPLITEEPDEINNIIDTKTPDVVLPVTIESSKEDNRLVKREDYKGEITNKELAAVKDANNVSLIAEKEIINSEDYLITEAYSVNAVIPVNKEIYSLPGSVKFLPHTNSANLIENNLIATRIPVSLFVFYSPNYSYCLLKDNTPDLVDDVQMYKDQERPEFSYSTGLSLRYALSPRWGFSAGLTYSTVVKSISLLKVYAEGTEDNMYYAYHTSSGMIELPNPENTVLHQGDSLNLNGEGEKILKFVSVPLMARYVIPKEKINWFFNGGLSVNFLVQDQARISTVNAEETVNNKTQGLKRTSYGFVVGAGVEYKLFDNLNLVFEPVYKGTFTSITEDAAVKNYPFSVGINLGASINF